MKSHPYEYKVMVEYINPEKDGLYPHFTHTEYQTGLTQTLEDVFKILPDALTEGWEVVSHDIAVSRNTLIVTVLLKRLKKV
jgi:hypothetical protein